MKWSGNMTHIRDEKNSTLHLRQHHSKSIPTTTL